MTEIRLDRRLIVRFFAACIIFLAVFGVGVQWSKYRLGHGSLFGLYDLFDLDGEGNLPAWFESLLFLFVSAQLYLIGCAKKTAGDRWAAHWKALSWVFIALSMDEVASVHEKTIIPLQGLLHIRGGYLFFAWIVLGAAFVLVLGVIYFRFFMHLPRRVRRDAVIASVLFLGGTLVAESFGGRYFALHGQDNLPYDLLAAFEEILEMAGLWYWIRSLFFFMQEHEPPLTAVRPVWYKKGRA